MEKKSEFPKKRRLKALKHRGPRHSFTISGNILGSPHKTLESVSSKTEKHPPGSERSKVRNVENITVSIDLDVKEIEHSKDFSRLLATIVGLSKVRKDFEVLSTAEKIILAFGDAGFNNVVSIDLDGKNLYYNPEDYFDLKEALSHLIQKVNEDRNRGNVIFVIMVSKEYPDCIVEVEISRVHSPWMHDILIKFNGILPEVDFRGMICQLEEKLDIPGLEKAWKGA